MVGATCTLTAVTIFCVKQTGSALSLAQLERFKMILLVVCISIFMAGDTSKSRLFLHSQRAKFSKNSTCLRRAAASISRPRTCFQKRREFLLVPAPSAESGNVWLFVIEVAIPHPAVWCSFPNAASFVRQSLRITNNHLWSIHLQHCLS